MKSGNATEGGVLFVGTAGRCAEREFLEFHHVQPFGEGGATTTENLQLRCRAHNAYEARSHFGLLGETLEDPPTRFEPS